MEWQEVLSDGVTRRVSDVFERGVRDATYSLVTLVQRPDGVIVDRTFTKEGRQIEGQIGVDLVPVEPPAPKLVPWESLADVPDEFFDSWVRYRGIWSRIEYVDLTTKNLLKLSASKDWLKPSDLFGCVYTTNLPAVLRGEEQPKPCGKFA